MTEPTIELAMIVRNGGAGLARAIRSALPVVQRVTIGDTGSTDNSADIAEGLGARVLHIPWEDDFSKARNAVLRTCESDWILIMDADEMLDSAGAATIPALAAEAGVDAWEVWRWNYIRNVTSRSGIEPARVNPNMLKEALAYPAYTRHLNVLLFRRRPDLYFEYEVHETVSNRVRELGLRTSIAPFVIHHFGYAEDTELLRQQKRERYHQLGIHKVQKYPGDHWAHYELGLSELEFRRNPQAALVNFQTALKINPECTNAWIYAGISLIRIGRMTEAMDCFNLGDDKRDVNALICEGRGDIFFHGGDFAQAMHQYRLCGSQADMSPLVACKLGVCEVKHGQPDEGLARIRGAVEREPQFAELYDIWIAAALACADLQGAADVAERRLIVGQPPPDAFLMAAMIQAQLDQWDRSASILREGVKRHPGNPMLQQEWRTADARAGGERPKRRTSAEDYETDAST